MRREEAYFIIQIFDILVIDTKLVQSLGTCNIFSRSMVKLNLLNVAHSCNGD